MKATANGIEINYVLEGPADAPVVTLSHSLAADLGMWEPQMAALADTFRVLRYDTRGHGGTPVTTDGYDFDTGADDVAAVLRELGIARTHFVGLSMGGMVGMGLGLRHPGVLRSLVLCDTMSEVGNDYRAAADGRIETAGRDGMEAMVEGTIARWFTAPFVERNPPVLDTIRAMIRSTSLGGFVGINNALKELDYTDRLHGIRTPTLLIVGDQDPSTPPAASRVIQERIDGAEMVVIEDAAHLSNVEQPEAFNAALIDFLARRR